MTAAPLSATPNHAKCERSSLHKSQSTPSVVFLAVNINMRTAVPRATNGNNRPNLNAIFLAARASKATIFGGGSSRKALQHIFRYVVFSLPVWELC